MRRCLGAVVLSGCFGEPTDDKVATTSVVMTTADPDSSSSDDDTSSSEGSESSSSSGEAVDPGECPEWCIQGCDKPLDIAYCRCTQDEYCQDGLHCEGYMPPDQLGHCRE